MEETEAESIEYVASGKNNESHKLGKITKIILGVDYNILSAVKHNWQFEQKISLIVWNKSEGFEENISKWINCRYGNGKLHSKDWHF